MRFLTHFLMTLVRPNKNASVVNYQIMNAYTDPNRR